MKAVTTFGTAASQMIRRTGSEADRKWIESWQRWIRRLSALAFGGITAAGVYLYVDGQDTIAASGRTRLLLTTRQEERELGDAVSEQLLAQVAQGVCFVADVPGGTARGASAGFSVSLVCSTAASAASGLAPDASDFAVSDGSIGGVSSTV